MFLGMYKHTDCWHKTYYLSARMCGFKSKESALKAINARSKSGFIADMNNRPLAIVENGIITLSY